jgi:hypothetical protein
MSRSILFKLCSRAPRTRTKPRRASSAAFRERGLLVSSIYTSRSGSKCMTAGQSSEENDGHQVRAPIGLAGGRALQRAGSRAGIPRAIRRLHRFRSIGSRSGRIPPLPRPPPSRGRIRRLRGWPAIVVRAGRLRPGRTGHPAAAEPFLDLSGEDSGDGCERVFNKRTHGSTLATRRNGGVFAWGLNPLVACGDGRIVQR